jgi:hypothetical protein
MATAWMTLAAGTGLLCLACDSARAATRVELWPLLDASEQYSDNLLMAADAKSDAVTTLIGGASLGLVNPQRRLELDYLTDGQLYAEHSEFDRLAKDHYLGLHDQETLDESTRLWVADTFIDGQSMFGLALIGAEGLNPQLGETLLQRNAQTNEFDSLLHHDFDSKFSADFDVHQALYAASSGGPGLSTDQGAAATVYYAPSRRLRAGIGCDVEDFRFSSGPKSDAYMPYFSLVSDLSPRIRLTSQAGPLIIQSSKGMSTDVGYSAGGDYRGERWDLDVSSGRAASMTAGFAGAGISQFAYGAASYALSRGATLYTSAGYTRLTGGGVSAELISYAVGVNYRLDRQLTLYSQYLWFRTTRPGGPAALTDAVAVGMKLDARPWRWMWR